MHTRATCVGQPHLIHQLPRPGLAAFSAMLLHSFSRLRSTPVTTMGKGEGSKLQFSAGSGGLLQQSVATDPKIRELLDLQIELQHLGLDKDLAVPVLGKGAQVCRQVWVLPPPVCSSQPVCPLCNAVLCGAQSAGKSSILQRITSVEMPRSDGTCTRAPTMLNLHRAEQPWECQVSLR